MNNITDNKAFRKLLMKSLNKNLGLTPAEHVIYSAWAAHKVELSSSADLEISVNRLREILKNPSDIYPAEEKQFKQIINTVKRSKKTTHHGGDYPNFNGSELANYADKHGV